MTSVTFRGWGDGYLWLTGAGLIKGGSALEACHFEGRLWPTQTLTRPSYLFIYLFIYMYIYIYINRYINYIVDF